MRSRRVALLITAGVVACVVSAIAWPSEEKRFIKAIRDGKTRTVANLLAARPELALLEEPHKAGSTPVLHIALSAGHKEIVRLLVNHGATPDKYPHALLLARDTETAQFLIEHGADVNRQGDYGRTPLHFFAASDNTAMVEFLLDHGADVNVKGQGGETPLHGAAQEGCLNAARLLVARGADVRVRSSQNKTPLDLAVRPVWDPDAQGIRPDRIRTCKAVASYLVSSGSPCTILELAWMGDMDRLTSRLTENPSLTNASVNGEPLLFAAVRGGNAEVVEYLLEHGAAVDVKGRFQQTALQVAAYVGHAEVAGVLLNHGADANSRGPYGETALHWAAARENTDVVAVLLGRGADPDIQTGAHAMDLNVIAPDADPVEREIHRFQTRHRWRLYPGRVQFAFPPRLSFTTGDTALHVAAYRNYREIVDLLLAHGADVSRTNHWGQTALHRAAVCGYAETVEELLQGGADPRARTQRGLTAADLARQIKDRKLVRLLNMRRAP